MLIAGMLVPTPAYAKASGKRKNKMTASIDSNPLPYGKGKIVGGILSTSIGPGVGLLMIFFSAFRYCNADSENYDSCQRDKKNQQAFGGVIGIGGIVIGVPLIVFGIKERRAWHQWNRENVPEYKAERSPDPGRDFRLLAAQSTRTGPVARSYLVPVVGVEF